VRRALEELAELEDLEIAQHARAAVATTAWRVNVEPASAAVSLGDGGHKSLPSMSLPVLNVPCVRLHAREQSASIVVVRSARSMHAQHELLRLERNIQTWHGTPSTSRVKRSWLSPTGRTAQVFVCHAG